MPYPYPPGRIESITGCMFSGKSEELVRRLTRCVYAKLPFQVFKPEIDDRHGENCIGTHSEQTLAAEDIPSWNPLLILERIDPETRVVGIDEAQFFEATIVEVCERLADKGVRVIVAGLDLDYRAKPFGWMPSLLARSDGGVTKVTAICSCGNQATRTHRFSQSKEQVVVGAADKYEPLCRACYAKANPNRLYA